MEDIERLDESARHGRYLTFAMGGESFGIEISHVLEIVGMHPVTKIPEAPAYVKGVINLRGKIIPVIDVRLRFGRESAEFGDRTCIIVVDIQGVCAGLIVDSVSEVADIADADIVPPPDYRTGVQTRYIKAIGKAGGGVKLLLDCEKLLSCGEAAGLGNIG